MTELRKFAAALAVTALALDWLYTLRYWLIGLRPHRFRRYLAIVALMSVEAAAIHRLVRSLA